MKEKIRLLLLLGVIVGCVYSSKGQILSVYTSRDGSQNTLIDSVYLNKGKFKFVKTVEGEVNNMVIQKVKIGDTTYYKLKNYLYLINQKYFNITPYSKEQIYFRFVGKDKVILKKLNSEGSSAYYVYKKAAAVPWFSLQ